jgi:DNA-directed RNA polymerase alpha subunit
MPTEELYSFAKEQKQRCMAMIYSCDVIIKEFEEEKQKIKDKSCILLENAGLSVRCYNALKRYDFVYIEDLKQLGYKKHIKGREIQHELLSLPKFGEECLRELINKGYVEPPPRIQID